MVELLIFLCFLVILVIVGLISDYILPHIKAVNDYIDNLPMMLEREESNACAEQKGKQHSVDKPPFWNAFVELLQNILFTTKSQ